ncbi:hypothetical protein BDK92_3123 [Micromonospora pisi]|uniref:Rho termination factor-like protein n=1 Tax=Micromonospora pisi TaxID=589240 RepID=A0A495JKD2_9ACTN|nr:hypothetical protein BDK92_3123 [Micromonospora pisi]
MAQRSSSSRGGTATATRSRAISARTSSPSDIAQLTADQIRGQLRKRGITGISALRKDDLVQRLARAMRAEGRAGGGSARQSTGPAKRTGTAARKSSPAARKSTASARTSTASARKSTSPARKSASSARTRTASGQVSAAARQRRASPSKAAPSTAARTMERAKNAAANGIRMGRTMSRSLKYAQPISSPDQRPERPGRSLVTTSHEVIRRWARARKAKPATIAGTERDGRAGVLTFNFPGWREGGRLRQITWEQWFKTFDLRRLNFIYQEQRSDGKQSNFFKPESPDREDG